MGRKSGEWRAVGGGRSRRGRRGSRGSSALLHCHLVLVITGVLPHCHAGVDALSTCQAVSTEALEGGTDEAGGEGGGLDSGRELRGVGFEFEGEGGGGEGGGRGFVEEVGGKEGEVRGERGDDVLFVPSVKGDRRHDGMDSQGLL